MKGDGQIIGNGQRVGMVHAIAFRACGANRFEERDRPGGHAQIEQRNAKPMSQDRERERIVDIAVKLRGGLNQPFAQQFPQWLARLLFAAGIEIGKH